MKKRFKKKQRKYLSIFEAIREFSLRAQAKEFFFWVKYFKRRSYEDYKRIINKKI